MKVIFLGTPEFAVVALHRLIESEHEVALVFTQPDRPRGRGRKIESSPVKALALKEGLNLLQPDKIAEKSVVEAIVEAGADVAVVAAFGQLLPPAVLNSTPHGTLNIHPSLLPAYRGAAPIQRCLMEGITTTGVTIMLLDEGLDTGPLIAQQSIEILEDDDGQSLGHMLAALGADMILQVIDEIERTGQIESVAQEASQATYAPSIRKEEGLIDWKDPTGQIMFRLRALTPWPGVYTFIAGKKRLSILQGESLWENEADALGEMNQEPPGTVTSFQKGFGFTVKTGDGHLLVTAIQPQGRKRMDAAAFINGRAIAIGNLLGPPQD